MTWALVGRLAGVSGLASAALLASCSGDDRHFEVGDCVTTESRMHLTESYVDYELESADCADAVSAITAMVDDEPIVYEIVSAIDRDERCDPGSWDSMIEFDHEPHDVKYCLLAATLVD